MTPATPHFPEKPKGGFSPLLVLRAARKHWPIVVAIAALIALGTTFYTLGQKRIYEAHVTLHFDPKPTQPLGRQVQTVVELGSGAYWNNQEYYGTEFRIIRSRRVTSSVVRKLMLHKDASFLANASPQQEVPPREVSVETAALMLAGRITVAPVKSSRLATITYRDADPERAQRVLDTLADTYVAQNLESMLESTNVAVKWLEDQRSKLKGDLEKEELDLHGYKKTNSLLSVSYDDQSNMLREQITQLNAALTSAQGKGAEVAARRKVLASVKNGNPDKLPARELLDSPVLTNLRQQYVGDRRERDGLMASGKGANHPDVRDAQAKVARSRKALLEEVHNIKGALDREHKANTLEMAGLQKLLSTAKKRALELNLKQVEYNRLRRTKENTEKLYTLVMERTAEGDLSRMMRFNNIRKLDPPLRPGAPVYPRVPSNIAAGILFGLVLGLFAALVRELLDRTVKTQVDIEEELGLPFLGLIPQIDGSSRKGTYYGATPRRKRKQAAGRPPELVVHDDPMSGIAEAARALRTNVMFMSPDKPHRTFLVTSAGPAEGKTTVACSLAITMAQAGQSVCLVDCDMRRPRVHRVFGKSNAVGLSTALLEPETLDEVSVESEVPNLSVLPAGPTPPNPAELVHSDAFGRLLVELQKRYDRIVLDSPPAVLVTDAVVLSARVDGTVLVVRALRTKKELARRASRALRDVGSNLLGSVLNAVDFTRSEFSYGDYYYSPYRRDPNSEDDAPASRGDNDAASPPPLA